MIVRVVVGLGLVELPLGSVPAMNQRGTVGVSWKDSRRPYTHVIAA